VCKVLVAHPKFQGVAVQVAIAEYLIRNVKTAAKHMATPAPKAVQTPQVPALKGMTPMGFNLSECEDAPF